mmetsp:Transcript_14283/g.60179  ORF Transcript_14283/g.60179 Transcript_14283/m.60179 type:complete len:234 (-) Transcript_14283:2219-2920(-)
MTLHSVPEHPLPALSSSTDNLRALGFPARLVRLEQLVAHLRLVLAVRGGARQRLLRHFRAPRRPRELRHPRRLHPHGAARSAERRGGDPRARNFSHEASGMIFSKKCISVRARSSSHPPRADARELPRAATQKRHPFCASSSSSSSSATQELPSCRSAAALSREYELLACFGTNAKDFAGFPRNISLSAIQSRTSSDANIVSSSFLPSYGIGRRVIFCVTPRSIKPTGTYLCV